MVLTARLSSPNPVRWTSVSGAGASSAALVNVPLPSELYG